MGGGMSFLIQKSTMQIFDLFKRLSSEIIKKNCNIIFLSLKLVFKVGGSVGLWLGLGVVQAAQLCATCLVPLLRRKTRKESIKVAS